MIDWIGEVLTEWAAWSRGDGKLTPGGTIIGRMMKRNMLRGITVEGIDVDALNDDYMLSVDAAIATLPKKYIRFCKLYYKGGLSMSEVGRRFNRHYHESTMRKWRDDIHKRLEKSFSMCGTNDMVLCDGGESCHLRK